MWVNVSMKLKENLVKRISNCWRKWDFLWNFVFNIENIFFGKEINLLFKIGDCDLSFLIWG